MNIKDLRSYFGAAYSKKPDDKLKRMVNEENVLKDYNSKHFSLRILKKFKSLFKEFGDGSMITAPLKGSSLKHVSIGANTFLNAGCTILGGGDLVIGNNCWIGPNVTFATVGHPSDVEKRKNTVIAKDIVIQDNVFIGANATILYDVFIGEGATVAAGAVVVRGVYSRDVVGGVPAKILKC